MVNERIGRKLRYRKLSPTGDYSFGGGQADFYINVPAAVAQAVQTRLLLWLGEWYLNTSDGTPYLESILGKHSQQTADTVIQDQILNTQGMINISEYSSELDPDTRSMTVTNCTINTIYGTTPVDLSNNVNF